MPRYRVQFLAAEGVRTGDGRVYEALDFREPPLDLYVQYGSQHTDVNETHLVGHITDLGRAEGGVVWADLDLDPNEPEAERAARHIEQGGQGISVDLVIDSSTPIVLEDDGTIRIAAATIGGATLVSIPAYAEALVDPAPLDAPMMLPMGLVASAAVAPVPSLLAGAGFPLTAGAAVDLASWELVAEHFARPALSGEANYINVDDDGRVWGWIAPAERCHQSYPGTCVLASDQSPDLSDFLRNVLSVADERVPVGFLTMDTTHATTAPGTSTAAVAAHYDDTRNIAAIVTAGVVPEGEHSAGSVWFSGSVSPRLDAWQRTVLAAGQVSGDWRADPGQPSRTLRAALVVPVPGFLRSRDPVYASGATGVSFTTSPGVTIQRMTVNGVEVDPSGSLVAAGSSPGCGCGGEGGCSCPPAPAPLTAAQQRALARVADEHLDVELAALDADMALADLPQNL